MPLLPKSPLLDWIYPPGCALCYTPLRRGKNLCASCAEDLPALSANCCQRCGQSFDGNLSAPVSCPNCITLKPSFDFATAAVKSNEASILLVHQFKLLKHPELGHDLASVMAQAYRRDSRLASIADPLLIPVPLHGSRLRSRQFNQAAILTQFLAKELEMDSEEALKRKQATLRQATLSRRQRLKNLRKAFQLRVEPARLADRNIILIDDVFTTGSTAQECARALKVAKPASIVVFTMVRA